MTGHDYTWLDMNCIAINGGKWLEMARMAEHGFK